MYIGNIEYHKGKLEHIAFPDGRLVPDYDENGLFLGTYRPEYFRTDHLGNTRLTFSDFNHDMIITTKDDPETLEDETEITAEHHYYPFGLSHTGPWYESVAPENKYLFNGKEWNEDFGLNMYDYGARGYMPDLGRWGGVDALAEKYYSWSPYNYVMGNPIRNIDPDGRGVYADIYNALGNWIGTDRKNDGRVLVLSSTDNTQLTQNQASIIIAVHDFLGGYPRMLDGAGLTDLPVNHDELQLLAGVAYGEAGTGNVTEEIYGIASALVNNNDLRGEGASLTETINDVAYAATDGNARFNAFDGATPAQRNANAGMTTAVAGAINAITGGVDHSNGATGWDGADLRTNNHRFGLNVANPSHDIYNVGDRPLRTPRNGSNYLRQTTAAHGRTVFMRIHPNFVAGGGRAY